MLQHGPFSWSKNYLKVLYNISQYHAYNIGVRGADGNLVPQFEHKYAVELRIKNLVFYTNRITYDYISNGIIYANNVEMDIDDFIGMLRRWTE